MMRSQLYKNMGKACFPYGNSHRYQSKMKGKLVGGMVRVRKG